MDDQSGNWHVRPSHLAVACSVCGIATPYNPTISFPLCSNCQAQRMAWSHNANEYQIPHTTNYGYGIPPGSMGDYMPQDCYTLQGMDCGYPDAIAAEPTAPGLMSPSFSLKRKADVPLEVHGSSAKRMFTNNSAYLSSPIRQLAFGGEMTTQARGESPAQNEDEELVDAPEEPQEYGGPSQAVENGRFDSGTTANDGDFVEGEMEEDVEKEIPPNLEETEPESSGMDASPQEQDNDEADLFARMFSHAAKEDSEDHEYGDSGSPSENNDDSTTEILVDAAVDARAASSTSTAKNSRATAYARPSLQASTDLNPSNRLCRNYTYLRDFHNRAKPLIPRLPLAEHRYWIGVLNVGGKPKAFHHEKHFTWMKGNRLTTVSTVWHTYQNTTATDDFVLLLGMEKVAFGDRMEELDYFDEKKIMFRAVEHGHEDAGGRMACQGVVPAGMIRREIIEID